MRFHIQCHTYMNATETRPGTCRTLDCLAGRRTLHLHQCGYSGCLPQYLSTHPNAFSKLLFASLADTSLSTFQWIIHLTFINDLSTTRACGSSPANVFDPGSSSPVLSFFAFWSTRSLQPRTPSGTFRTGRTWSRLVGTRISCIT